MINRVFMLLRRDGLRLFLIKAMAKVLRVDIGVEGIRKKVWAILRDEHNYVVAYGPFAGMKLNRQLWWGDDRITQTLGIYEVHVMERILDFAEYGATKFIDVGAADGYFVIGLTYSNSYSNALAFEISEEGQRLILENAKENKCENKIQVYGEANLESLAKEVLGSEKATVMIDIEGAEYDFLSDEMLEVLSDSYVICELHHNLVDDGLNRERKLLSRVKKYFNIELVKRDSYNPNDFSELDNLGDSERLIAVSEGRTKNTRWLVCSPK